MERVSNDKDAMSQYQIQDNLFGCVNMTPCNDLCWKAVSSGKSLYYEMFTREHRTA
jgi:succinate dehydrogenase/fumarate reductase-like Fe-S protein